MTNADIREFKENVKQVIMKKYKLSEIDAYRAVKNSYLTQALIKDKDFVMHDTVEEWADFVHHELFCDEKLRM